MRKELTRLSPISMGLIYGVMLLIVAILYVALVFAVGFDNLPPMIKPETELFLIEELDMVTALQISGVFVVLMTIGGFFYGLLYAILYNIASAIVGGLKGSVRDLD